MIKYKGHIYEELRTAAKIVMYHGTCTGPGGKVLHSILKEGLKPEPKEKAYKSPYPEDEEDFYELDLDTETTMRLDESLGGAYLTNSLGEARRYAKHACQEGTGHPVLVAAQVETRTPEVKIDEDFLINYSWEYVTKHFKPQNNDTYYIDLYEWLTVGKVDWQGIAKGWIKKQFPHAKISEHRWNQILPKAGEMLQSIAIVTFLQNHEQDAHNEARENDDYWEVDVWYELTDYLESYKEAIAFVTEKLKEVTEPPSIGQHNIRILKPLGYKGANRILAVISWHNRGGWSRPGEYMQMGRVYYSHDPAALKTMLDAVQHRYSKWKDSTGKIIYDQRVPPEQMELPNVAKVIRYKGARYVLAQPSVGMASNALQRLKRLVGQISFAIQTGAQENQWDIGEIELRKFRKEFEHDLNTLDQYLTHKSGGDTLPENMRVYDSLFKDGGRRDEVFYLSDGGFTRLYINFYDGEVRMAALGTSAKDRWRTLDK